MGRDRTYTQATRAKLRKDNPRNPGREENHHYGNDDATRRVHHLAKPTDGCVDICACNDEALVMISEG